MDLNDKKLAVIIPVYNEEDALAANFSKIYDILQDLPTDVACLLVDDGSKDKTWQVLQDLTERYQQVSAVGFSRNFGKEIALTAGLDNIDADLYVMMDSDLQHPPACIFDMLALMAEKNADIVEGVKASRGRESLKYKLIAKSFYKIQARFTGLNMDDSSDFKLMTREVVENIRNFHESNVFFRGVVHWVGFKTVKMPFEVDERQNGTSSFSTFSLLRLAANAIFSYTSKPLLLPLGLSMIFTLFSVILGIQTLYNYFSGIAVSGFSTVILLLLIIGSILMFTLGIIGVYIARVYDEVKQRPRYIVQRDKTLNKEQ